MLNLRDPALEYPLGVAELDRQHLDLTRQLRGLYSAANAPRGMDIDWPAAVRRLEEDLHQHFAVEETLLRLLNPAARPEHKRAHARVLSGIERLRAPSGPGSQPPTPAAVGQLWDLVGCHLQTYDARDLAGFADEGFGQSPDWPHFDIVLRSPRRLPVPAVDPLC